MVSVTQYLNKWHHSGIRQYLRAWFLTASSPTARLVRQTLWQDVTFLRLQCWKAQAVDVTVKRGFYAQTAPITPLRCQLSSPLLRPSCSPSLSEAAKDHPPPVDIVVEPATSRVSNDAATEATGVHREEEESTSSCITTNLPRRAANASQCSWKDSCLFMTAMFYVVIWAHAALSLLSLEIYSVTTGL